MPRDLIEVLSGKWPAVAGFGVAVVGVTSWVKNLFDIRKTNTEIRLLEEQISAQRIQNKAATGKLSDERLRHEHAAKQKRRDELVAKRNRRQKINRRLATITPVLAIALALPILYTGPGTIKIADPVGTIPATTPLAVDLGQLTETLISGKPFGSAHKIIGPAAQDALQNIARELGAYRGAKLKFQFQGPTNGDRIWLDITDDQNRTVASVVFVIRDNKAEKIEVPFKDPDMGSYAK